MKQKKRWITRRWGSEIEMKFHLSGPWQHSSGRAGARPPAVQLLHRELARRPWMGMAGKHGSCSPLAAMDADGLKSLPDAFNPLHLLLLPPPLPAASPPYLLLPAPHPCTPPFLLLSLHSPASASLHHPCNPPAPLLLLPSSLHPPLSLPEADMLDYG